MAIETLEEPLAYQCAERPRNLVEHWWEIQPTDLDGRPTGPAKLVPGSSWLANFAALVRTFLGDTTTTATNTSGLAATMTTGLSPVRFWSPQLLALPFGTGQSGRGINLGRSSAALDTAQFDLQNGISNGTGTNQLLFQDDVMNALETIAGGFRIFHERLFLNQSGAPVAVEEVGIRAFCNVSPSAQLFQLVRDLVSVSVPDASGVIVKYREEFTV